MSIQDRNRGIDHLTCGVQGKRERERERERDIVTTKNPSKVAEKLLVEKPWPLEARVLTHVHMHPTSDGKIDVGEALAIRRSRSVTVTRQSALLGVHLARVVAPGQARVILAHASPKVTDEIVLSSKDFG